MNDVTDPKKDTDKKAKVAGGQKETIHMVTRTVSKTGITGETGAQALDQVETTLNEYLSRGWSLKETIYLGEFPEGYAYTWVLIRIWS